MGESRISESEIYTDTGGGVRIRTVEGLLPVEVLVGPEHLGPAHYFSAADAYHIGRALIEHAEDSGYDPDTDETHPPE